MDLGLKGKGALVVGANGGIGRAVCERLLEEGVGRLTLAVRSPSKGDELAAELARRHGDVEFFVVSCDLDDPESPGRAVAESAEAQGHAAVVVLCAGAAPRGGLWDLEDGDWTQGLNTKLVGGARLMTAAIPAMRENGWGRVVVIAGLNGRMPSGGSVVGGIVNVGLASLVSSVTKEVAADGVTVNAIDPGHVRTQRWEKAIADLRDSEGIDDLEAMARIRKGAPNPRMASPEDVASLVAFLCSDRAGSITGSTIPIDGGLYSGLY